MRASEKGETDQAMQRIMLKSKIHRATVTDADLHYVGSITIDEDLMEAADLMEEACNRWPGLREEHEYRLQLWRRGIVM